MNASTHQHGMKAKDEIGAVEMGYLRGACGVNRMDSEINYGVCGRFVMYV